jgi:FkbM family methyltransferase
MSMTTLIRRAGRRAGLSITRHPAPSTLEWLTRQVFAKLDINCVLDVGAYRGEYVTFLRNEVLFEGQVFSFEPAAASYRELKAASRHDQRWQGFPYGLGSKRETGTLNVFTSGDFNSLLSPNGYGPQRFATLAANATAEEVEIRRLDEVLPAVLEQVPSPRVFLKIDAQGSEMDVIDGAGEALPSIAALQLELSVRPIYRGQPSLPQTMAALADLGFELLGVFPIARDGLRVVEFDGVFCRAV